MDTDIIDVTGNPCWSPSEEYMDAVQKVKKRASRREQLADNASTLWECRLGCEKILLNVQERGLDVSDVKALANKINEVVPLLHQVAGANRELERVSRYLNNQDFKLKDFRPLYTDSIKLLKNGEKGFIEMSLSERVLENQLINTFPYINQYKLPEGFDKDRVKIIQGSMSYQLFVAGQSGKGALKMDIDFSIARDYINGKVTRESLAACFLGHEICEMHKNEQKRAKEASREKGIRM